MVATSNLGIPGLPPGAEKLPVTGSAGEVGEVYDWYGISPRFRQDVVPGLSFILYTSVYCILICYIHIYIYTIIYIFNHIH